jgi:hypothetical protein
MFRNTVFIINTTYSQGTQMDSKYVKAYESMLNQLTEAGPNVVSQSPSMGGVSMTNYDGSSQQANPDQPQTMEEDDLDAMRRIMNHRR